MPADYTARYGLDFNPFLKNSKEVIVESAEYREALFRLNYHLEARGFGILTDGAGKGKTIVIRSWAKKLNPALYKVVHISLSTVMEFYSSLIVELGASWATGSRTTSARSRSKSTA